MHDVETQKLEIPLQSIVPLKANSRFCVQWYDCIRIGVRSGCKLK